MSAGMVYLAGVAWDGAEGTDRRLVTALAAYLPVLWVDPPVSMLRNGHARPQPRVDEVAAGVRRLRTWGPPGVTRPVMRWVADRLVARAIRRTVGTASPTAVVVANPLLGFPGGLPGHRAFYVTDDWVAGAGLMGLSARHVARVESRNAQRAVSMFAVSPALVETVRSRTGLRAEVLANGCTVPSAPKRPRQTRRAYPVVGLVGQLNERLDLDLLEGVADRDLELLVVGGRRERDRDFATRLDSLMARPNVRWVGEQPIDALPTYFAEMQVGLTPYASSMFNRASFPLKTLDYLAVGLGCVATPSPAIDWLDTDLVVRAEGREPFADAVRAAAYREDSVDEAPRRRDFARRHTWDARAQQLLRSTTGPSGYHSDNDTAVARTEAALPHGGTL